MEDRFFVHQKTVSIVNTIEFVSDRFSYIVPRGRWCNIIVSNVNARSKEKSDDSNGKLFEVLHYFPK